SHSPSKNWSLVGGLICGRAGRLSFSSSSSTARCSVARRMCIGSLLRISSARSACICASCKNGAMLSSVVSLKTRMRWSWSSMVCFPLLREGPQLFEFVCRHSRVFEPMPNVDVVVDAEIAQALPEGSSFAVSQDLLDLRPLLRRQEIAGMLRGVDHL